MSTNQSMLKRVTIRLTKPCTIDRNLNKLQNNIKAYNTYEMKTIMVYIIKKKKKTLVWIMVSHQRSNNGLLHFLFHIILYPLHFLFKFMPLLKTSMVIDNFSQLKSHYSFKNK